MRFKFLMLSCIIFSCGNEKQNINHSESINQDFENFVNENSHPLNIDNYLSSNLIIGREDALTENEITSLTISGYDSYLLNGKGQITKSWNISNNYNEFSYDKNGLIQKIFYKQHTTNTSYLEQTFNYKKDGLLESITVDHFDDSNKLSKSELIRDELELNERKSLFKRGIADTPYQVDTVAKIILNYREDLVFCCGELMEGKNRLRYYVGNDGLIDSLVIEQMDSTKTMKFEYQYNQYK